MVDNSAPSSWIDNSLDTVSLYLQFFAKDCRGAIDMVQDAVVDATRGVPPSPDTGVAGESGNAQPMQNGRKLARSTSNPNCNGSDHPWKIKYFRIT